MTIFNISQISSSLRIILPIYGSGSSLHKKIIRTDYVIDKSYYAQISEVYGCILLRYNYGINRYLSELFIRICGFHMRTPYYLCNIFLDIQFIMHFFPNINKLLYKYFLLHLKKKFESHTYWSTLYLNKYPCRGQRRRTNASTPKKLNLVAKLNSV